MAKVIVNRTKKRYIVLKQSEPGLAPDTFYFTSTMYPSVSEANPVTFQASVLDISTLPDSAPPELQYTFAWDHAPGWAKFAAVNEDGTGWWYQTEPVMDESRGRWSIGFNENQSSRAWPLDRSVHLYRCWRDSLEPRPAEFPGDPEPSASQCSGQCSCANRVSDAISYIQVGLGNLTKCDPCCSCACACSDTGFPGGSAESTPDSEASETAPEEAAVIRSATVRILASNDGVEFVPITEMVLGESAPNSSMAVLSAPYAMIRAELISISGEGSVAAVTLVT